MTIKSKLLIAGFLLFGSLCLNPDSLHGQRDRGDRGDRENRSSRGDRGRSERNGGDRSERLMGFVRSMDRNNNGMLEPDEMSGRGQQWIQGMGFQTNRPIRTRDIERKIQRDERDRVRRRSDDEKEKNFSNTVPGFMATEQEVDPIQGFGFEMPNESIGDGKTTATAQYSSETIRQAEETLKRYDKNQNGVLDREEVAAARWGNPAAKDSDTNRDGRLSKTELLERYKRRETAWRDSKNSKTPSVSGRRSESGRRTLSGGGGSYGSSSRSGFSRRSSGGSSSSPSSSGDFDSRYRTYVKNQIETYDKNKDGKLSRSEVKSMSRPVKDADKNGDGYVDSDELFANYTKKDSGSSSKSSKGGSRPSYRSSSGSSSSSSDIRSKLRDSSQVAMADFTDDWTDELLEEFTRLDLNGDGYITKDEFEAANKKTSTSDDSSRSKNRASTGSRSRTRFGRNR